MSLIRWCSIRGVSLNGSAICSYLNGLLSSNSNKFASFHTTQRAYFCRNIIILYSPPPLYLPSSYPSFPLNITGVYGRELCRVQQCRGEWCRAPSTQTVPLRSRAHPHHICQWRPHQPSTRRREIFQAAREGEGEIVTLPMLTPFFHTSHLTPSLLNV